MRNVAPTSKTAREGYRDGFVARRYLPRLDHCTAEEWIEWYEAWTRGKAERKLHQAEGRDRQRSERRQPGA